MPWLLKKPNEEPETVAVLRDKLAQMQGLVGGYVESVDFTDNISLLINEEGALTNLPHNCGFCGPIVFVHITDDGDWADLDEEEIRKARRWCQIHEGERHPGPGIGLISGDANIRRALEEARDQRVERQEEWESL
jgi:hypothetical protein